LRRWRGPRAAVRLCRSRSVGAYAGNYSGPPARQAGERLVGRMRYRLIRDDFQERGSAMAKKNRIPKKVAGWKVPKTLRKSKQ
jgi:hypothetical protein